MNLTYHQAEALNSAIRSIALRHRARAAAMLATFGLHPGQEIVLLLLDTSAPQTQKQLADGAGCEPPTITLMLRKLEAAGLIHRAPSSTDARAMLVDLTDAGRALMPKLKQRWHEFAEHTLAAYTATSVPALLDILTDLAASLTDP
jgi:DNA-binding MarR family transcriptional regulator